MKPELTTDLPKSANPAKNNPFGCRNLLEKEIKVYEKNLEVFLKEHANEFVLIKGDHIEGFYADEFDAIDVGIKKYARTGSFLVRKIAKKQEVYDIPSITHGLTNADF